MKFVKIPYYVTLILCCFSFNNGLAQNRNYKIDSLQIKIYTEIEYVNGISKDVIVVKKIFCDYCSENQLNYLTAKAKELAYYDRYNSKKRLINGVRKFAMIIRVSKKDFAELKTKNDSIDN